MHLLSRKRYECNKKYQPIRSSQSQVISLRSFYHYEKNNNKIVEVNRKKYKNNKNHMCPTFYFTINAVSNIQYVWYNKAA